ncbi:MAG: class I SAM-dependent methyltransferase [bacterium]|nr:class I SAM-dependent methyltransferase [bacterium]
MKTCSICGNQNCPASFSKEIFLFFKCPNCGFIFVDTAHINLADYYNNPIYLHDNEGRGYVDYEADKAPMFSVYTNLLKKIQSHNLGRRLLDLGTANGYFLDVAARSGYLAEGIDLNASSVEEGRFRGRKITQGDLLSASFSPESFDVITAFDFFEHLPQDKLADNAGAIRKLLAANGTLAIITVNTASWWARIFGTKWHTWLPPEHISYFNNRNIKLFLENNKFDILEIRTIHKTFSLQYIFNFLYRYQRIFIWRWITLFLERFPALGTFALKLYLGDNMLILARKQAN